MAKAISYRDLTWVLLAHGFELERVRGSHHRFTHPSGAFILLPPTTSARAAMPCQVVAVRRQLDERGILSRDDFDTEVQSGSGRVRSRN